MIMVLRVTILVLLTSIVIRIAHIIFNKTRKLEYAKNQKRFFLLDDKSNPRKNFLLTYKGAVFEGEKYLGITGDSFSVISISLWPKNADKLEGMTHDDFLFIKSELAKSYPHASIEWNASVKDHLRKLMSISH